METRRPGRPTAQPHVPKARPDARPMRMALGAGGIAALSALATAIVLPPQFNVLQPQSQQVDPGQQVANQLSTDPSQAQPSILYIQLAPGQTAPPGAVVIDASGAPAPSSRTTTGTGSGGGGGTGSGSGAGVAQPPAQATAAPTPKPTPRPTPKPIQTTQSGKVKK
jgi:hypothetical protein